MKRDKHSLNVLALGQHGCCQKSVCRQDHAHKSAVSPYLESTAKRLIEAVLIVLLLAAALPVCVLIGVTILLVDGMPILFVQTRCGRDGQLFRVWKFRTLYPAASAEEYVPESLLRLRYTRTGGFLRAHRLDELPQLLGVLTASMALVGPRPERAEIARSYGRKQRLRLMCKPGVTGLWQVLAPRTKPIHRQMQYDVYYLRRASLGLDLRILVMTLLIMLRPSLLERRKR